MYGISTLLDFERRCCYIYFGHMIIIRRDLPLLIFGPVPSRRLGRSVGINNIPYKNCSYSCAYCQLGPTVNLNQNRRPFYESKKLDAAVNAKLKQAENYEPIDYLTFVADGEPALDLNLGVTINLLKKTGKKIAVISNASLIGDPAVRSDLSQADWVSLKIDTLDEKIWRRLNIPAPGLRLDSVLQGITEFARCFHGTFVTETMLVKERNDQPEFFERLSTFLTELQPAKSYLTIPTRPPAQSWATPPAPETLNLAYQTLTRRLPDKVELLISSEGENFAFTGNAVQDLLNITAVHPMTEAAVAEFLRKAQSGWETVQNLIDRQLLKEITFQDSKFYLRNWTQMSAEVPK
jgi:wyosine [tRNA(Phe)-imidazoG37] synthetase (radical SAM superfamily)